MASALKRFCFALRGWYFLSGRWFLLAMALLLWVLVSLLIRLECDLSSPVLSLLAVVLLRHSRVVPFPVHRGMGNVQLRSRVVEAICLLLLFVAWDSLSL